MKALFCWLVGIAFTSGLASAQTYSLAGDWNAAADLATNRWSYGTFSTGTTFVVPSTVSNNGSSTVDFWNFPPTVGQHDPNIEKNLTLSPQGSSNAAFRPGTVSFGPFQGPAVAQFIAPTAGLYDIAAMFQTDQIRAGSTGDGTTAYVYIGGLGTYTQVLSDPLSAQYGTAVNYSASDVALTSGEKVDFAVGGGAFTTEVDATLIVVPEPSPWAMTIAGLGFLVLASRRRTFVRVF